MKAIRVHTPAGPEALRLEDVSEPKPEAGQAVVTIEAAGVNFIDVYQRTGLYKVALPFTLGQEAAGTVTALGMGVSEPRVGTRVAYCGILGAYAPYAAVPADRLVALPDGVTARQGAAAMLQGMTAHYRSEEHTSELQSQSNLVCRLLLEKKNSQRAARRRERARRAAGVVA